MASLKRSYDSQIAIERMSKKAKLELDDKLPQIVRYLMKQPRLRFNKLISCLENTILIQT